MTNIIILNVFISIPRRIISHNRIIATIRIHIEANQIAIGIHIPILIQEPPPSRIIISALQVVQPRLGIVIIPAVTEGVIRPNDVLFQRGSSRNNGYGAGAPGIVGIGTDLLAACVVNSNNVALEILLKVEGVEHVGGVGFGSVLHPDGRSAFVIEIDQQVITPRFADDLCAVQGVNVVSPVHDLVGTDAVGVVFELQKGLAAVSTHLLQLPSVPGERIPVIGGRVADLVIGDRRKSNGSQLVARLRYPQSEILCGCGYEMLLDQITFPKGLCLRRR